MSAKSYGPESQQPGSLRGSGILRLSGGLSRFLRPRPTPTTSYTAGGQRFSRVRKVIRSEVAFLNGKGEQTPGAHILWGHGSSSDDLTLAMGEFLSPN